MVDQRDRTALETFRRLHEGNEVLVLPGVWDVVSARLFAAEGYPALGTTSTGIYWSAGRAGGWDRFLEASGRISETVEIPVSFDIENGFDEKPEVVRERVRQVIDAGACGINLEDGVVDGVLADIAIIEDKLRAIADLCEEIGFPLFVNARTDVYLGGPAELGEAVRRCQHFAELGADCVFVPGLVDAAAIGALVKEVPVPVNIYAIPGVPSVAQLADLGVARLSVGCGPMQALLAQARGIARSLRDNGDYESFVADWMPFEELEALCHESPAKR